ncbi:MAG: hypothetical protein GXO48_00160 [Chlorobi bacterium]|nr:hypothetical protein [Chlorobiota bacterium]
MNFSKPEPIKDFPFRYIFDTDTLISYDRFYPADIFRHLFSFMHDICQQRKTTICD